MAKLNGVKTLDMKNGEITCVEYNGAEYVKVDGKAQVGDLGLRIVKGDKTDITEGAFYAINGEGSYGIQYVDDVDDNCQGAYDKFTLYRKQSAPDSLTDRVDALEQRVDALEGAKQADGYRKVTDRDPKAGDFIKYDEVPTFYLTAGKYYEITEIDGADDPQIIDDDGDGYDTAGDEFDVYEKITQTVEQPLKVGDYIVPLPESDDIYGITNTEMELAKITNVHDDGEIQIEIIAHEVASEIGGGFDVDINYFRKATDEEVAQAKRKAVEARWAKIGRKPNEFKKGDIVKYKSDGEICEVVGINEENRPRVNTKSNGICTEYTDDKSDIELITPVEARFDLAGRSDDLQ